LKLVGDDHQAVVVALETLLDQLAVLQRVDAVLANFRIGFGMCEIREGIKRFVSRLALLELLLDDLKIAQAGNAGTGHDHRLGAAADERHHVRLEQAQHHFGLVLDQAVILKRHVLERFRHHASGIELFLIQLGHHGATQVVERLVRNDAGRDIDDVALGNGLLFRVGIERLAKQAQRRRGGRRGEGDDHLVDVVLADDLGELLLRVWLGRLVIRCIGGVDGGAERQADGGAHLPFLRAVRLVDQEGHAELLEFRLLLDLFQHPGELLLRGDDDRPALRHESRQVVRFPRQADDILEVGEVFDLILDVGVQRFAVGKDEHHVHQLFAGARPEQAVQPIRQPADGQRLAAARRMIDQIFAADVRRLGKARRNILRHFPHQTALVVTREQGESGAFRHIIHGVAMRHTDEEERQRFEQAVFRQHLAIKKFHRVFAAILGDRRVAQPGVVPAEVLLPAWVGGGLHIAGVGGKIEEGMLENLELVVAPGELRHRVMHRLVLLVLQLQRHDGQAIQEQDEVDFLVGVAEVKMRAKAEAVLAVLLHGGALGGTRPGVEQPELQPAHLETAAQQHPQRRVRQGIAQRLEYLLARIAAVIVAQFLERVGLRGVEKSPELILGDEMLGIHDVGLFEHAIAMHAPQKVGDMLLKIQFRSVGHAQRL